ncbi:AhpC/TSA family protein [Ancylomarina sp. DW003]|nr:TlpA disulfide reductase family protein [Ancylomarina sp. DW003]MDE5423119.1 AhpC/TSA family protein [Ancylomarina sp. DW003]
MKKLLFAVLAISVLFAACDTQKKYELSGKIEGQSEGKIFLNIEKDRKLEKIDSVEIVNGEFKFVGSVPVADMYYLQIEDKRGALPFFLENSLISIEANVEALRDAKITGSATQDVYKSFTDKMVEYKGKQEPIIAAYKKAMSEKNEEAAEKAVKEYEAVDAEKMVTIKSFVKENTSSVASAFITHRNLLNQLKVDEVEEIYNAFGENVKASGSALAIKAKIDVLKKVAVGQPAPDFTLNTPEGTPLSLSSLKGKVVVIDFWASWCGPCRRENPHMVEIYNELSPKGVEFLGVSLDKDKDKWLKAIEDDGLIWKHVSDLQYWNSAAAKLYGINGIPATVLIDQNGTIVAKKVFGDELKAEIEKLF